MAPRKMALDDIDHIVVLVMENRSFDHLLGYLSLDGGRPDIDGLRPGMSNPDNRSTPAIEVAPSRLQANRFKPGPNHHYEHVESQLGPYRDGQATMRGFVDDYARVSGVIHPELVMGYHDAQTVPVYDFFAEHYAVCDRWFSSVPGPTHVNRAFLLAGHSAGLTENKSILAHITATRLPTLFDRLSANDVSWRSYFQDVPFLRLFRQFKFDLAHVRHMKGFFSDVAQGTLPSVSWLDPNFNILGPVRLPFGLALPDGANDDHPPADVSRGQRFISKIYNALVANPAIWQKTLFIVTYDEHGGFFDHVEPPVRPARSPFGADAFARFGVRVPTFLVSPWIKARGVIHDELEHTSIARTILQRFAQCDGLVDMKERLVTAPSLAPYLESTCRSDALPVSVPLDPQGPKLVVGGISKQPISLEPEPPSELQGDLRDLRARLLGEGMPPGTV